MSDWISSIGTWYDLRRFWAPFKFTKNYIVSVVYHLRKRDHTDMIGFFFVNPQNNMISDITALFQ